MPGSDDGHMTGGASDAHPLRTTAVVVYATFLLLIFAIPQSLVNWLGDMNENSVQQALLRGAEGVRAVSHATRVDVAYVRARASFFALIGKDDD
jgi:hypothetical protein